MLRWVKVTVNVAAETPEALAGVSASIKALFRRY
jgi:hypothetical protein